MSMADIEQFLLDHPKLAFDRRTLAQRVAEENGLSMSTVLGNIDRLKRNWRIQHAGMWTMVKMPYGVCKRMYITIFSADMEGFETLVITVEKKTRRIPRGKVEFAGGVNRPERSP